MDFSHIMSLTTILATILSLFLSIINFKKTKKDMEVKIEATNSSLQKNLNNISSINNKQVSEISLKRIIQYTERYFKTISADNYFDIKIYKIVNDNDVILVCGSSNKQNAYQYKIASNTEFNETYASLEPYYKNNISYYHRHGKEYISENKNWKNQYQSIICCPVLTNKKIKGFLTIEIRNPLNDLININEIIKLLKLECSIISINNEFINFKENMKNSKIFNDKNDKLVSCYQWEETVDVSDDEDLKP